MAQQDAWEEVTFEDSEQAPICFTQSVPVA
jgi:hypothetical protein